MYGGSGYRLACSRLRDGGGKSFSNKKCEKRAGAGERLPAATAPFLKSCASYFRFARFNTFPLYYLRAWHRLVIVWRQKHVLIVLIAPVGIKMSCELVR